MESARTIGVGKVIGTLLATICFASPLFLYPLSAREDTQDRWIHVREFEGQGDISQLLVAKGLEGAIYYLLTGSGGLHRALGVGQSWTLANGLGSGAGLPRGGWGQIQIRALAVSPDNPLAVYAALQGVQMGRPTLYRTLDGGDSWQALGGMRDRLVLAIAIAPSNPQTMYAATKGDLFRSVDGGNTWVGVRGVPYGNTPSGDEWRSVEGRRAGNGEHGDSWLVLGDRSWRSTDEGASWREAAGSVPSNLDWGVVTGEEYQPASGAGGWLALAGLVYGTTDGGRNWQRAGSAPGWNQVRAMQVSASSSDLVYVGTVSEGLFVLRNGGATWHVGLADTEINSIVQGNHDPGLLHVATSNGLYRSTDEGLTWDVVNQDWAGRRVAAVALAPDRDHVVYASIEDMGVHQSPDGGAHWHSSSRGLGRQEVHALVTDTTHPSTLYAVTRDGLWQYVPAR